VSGGRELEVLLELLEKRVLEDEEEEEEEVADKR